MRMPQSNQGSLWSRSSAAGRLSERSLSGADGSVALGDLARGSSLGGRLGELGGRCVLVATTDQLTAALALIELDGVARRLVLSPPDLPREHVPFVMATAAVDAIVSDRTAPEAGMPSAGPFVICSPKIAPADFERTERYQTEWILLTSGTTGLPKMVVHTLSSLAGAIQAGSATPKQALWSTFYDIRRYGGLQILLRALLGGGSLVLSSAREPTGDFLVRAAARGVTHMLGTPTHWRNALMSPSARRLTPQYVRLSGEIADQAILDHLRAFYPGAAVVHAFASTEAGVGFEVGDGLAGFPASLIGHEDAVVEMSGERYYFVGRRDGVINVGGQKVHPEEVEAVINSHPQVRVSQVRAKKNAFMGALVVADVVLNGETGAANGGGEGLERAILEHCRATLPRHKVPAAINFVSSLAVAPTGKIVRRNA